MSHALPNAYRRYRQQVYRVTCQNESFEIGFDAWYQWWQDQGIDKNYDIASDQPRPAGPNRGCMVKKNPRGRWILRNVELLDKPGVIGNPPPVGHRNGRSRPISTPAGEFESISAAARHYGITTQSMRNRMDLHPDLYQLVRAI
jgi:hypothetical protein